MADGIGRLEAHVLLAIDQAIPARSFGRIHHLPAAVLDELIDQMQERGLIEDERTFTPVGRQTKDRIEALTDRLAAAPYDALLPDEVDELLKALAPIARRIDAAS